MDNVKKKRCHIALDYDTKLISTADADKDKTYELPDGNIITIGAKRFSCAEALFEPIFTVQRSQRIPRLFFFPNVMKCDVYSRKDLYANAVLTGDTAMFQRIAEHHGDLLMGGGPKGDLLVVESQVTAHDEGIFKLALVWVRWNRG